MELQQRIKLALKGQDTLLKSLRDNRPELKTYETSRFVEVDSSFPVPNIEINTQEILERLYREWRDAEARRLINEL